MSPFFSQFSTTKKCLHNYFCIIHIKKNKSFKKKMDTVTSVTNNVTRQLAGPMGVLFVLMLALLAIVLTGFVNTKVDGVSNEKITVGVGKVGASTNTANEVTWVQPKMTLLKSITLVCTTAAVVATGDIGYKVGTASGGAQIVAAITDQLLDGGTDVPKGAVYSATLVGATVASDPAPAANVNFTDVKRTLYFQITHTTAATDVGAFKWVVEYQAV